MSLRKEIMRYLYSKTELTKNQRYKHEYLDWVKKWVNVSTENGDESDIHLNMLVMGQWIHVHGKFMLENNI